MRPLQEKRAVERCVQEGAAAGTGTAADFVKELAGLGWGYAVEVLSTVGIGAVAGSLQALQALQVAAACAGTAGGVVDRRVQGCAADAVGGWVWVGVG